MATKDDETRLLAHNEQGNRDVKDPSSVEDSINSVEATNASQTTDCKGIALKYFVIPSGVVLFIILIGLLFVPLPPTGRNPDNGDALIFRGKNLLRGGNFLGNISVPEDVKITFDILPVEVQSGWTSLFHFTKTGNDYIPSGSRIPAVFFLRGTTRLHVRFDGEHYINTGIMGDEVSGLELPLNEVSRVIISVIHNNVDVFVNGAWVYTTILPAAPVTGNAMFFMGNPWYPVSSAVIPYFAISKNWVSPSTFSGSVVDSKYQKTYQAKNLLKFSNKLDVVTVPPNLVLEFDVTPYSNVSKWSSLIHFTMDGKDKLKPGSRVPGVFFNQGSTRLYIRFDGQNYTDRGISGFESEKLVLPLLSQTRVTISVIGTELNVFLNGTWIVSTTLPSQPLSGIAALYVGDPFYPPANASITHISISKNFAAPVKNGTKTSTNVATTGIVDPSKPLPTNGGVVGPLGLGYVPPNNVYQANLLKPGSNKIAGIQVVPKNPVFTFDVRPVGISKEYTNLFRFTLTDQNSAGSGSRAPAVFFNPLGTTLHVRFDLPKSPNVGFWGSEGNELAVPVVDGYTLCPKADMLGSTYKGPYWVNSTLPAACIRDCTTWFSPKDKTLKCVGILHEIDFVNKGSYCYIKGSSLISTAARSSWCLERGLDCNVYVKTTRPQLQSNTCPTHKPPLELPLNAKTRVTLVFKGPIAEIHFNGSLVASKSFLSPPIFGNATLFIGDSYYSPANAILSYLSVSDGAELKNVQIKPRYIKIGNDKLSSKNWGPVEIPENVVVEFFIKPLGSVPDWSSVLHFTSNGQDYAVQGSRMPAVFLSSTNALHVRLDGPGYINRGIEGNESPALTLRPNTVSRVVISVLGSTLNVHINGNLAASTILPGPPSIGRASLWAADPFYKPANAIVYNVTVSQNQKSSYIIPQKALSINRPRSLGTVYVPANLKLVFDVTPFAVIKSWGTLLRFSSNGLENNGGGSRMPAIYFAPNSTGLHVRFDGITYVNMGFYGTEPGIQLPVGKVSRVTVSISGSTLELLINNLSKGIVELPSPPFIGYATLYAGLAEWPPANATISYISVSSNDVDPLADTTPAPIAEFIPPTQKVWHASLKGQLHNYTLTKKYVLDLDITPTGILNFEWASILRFTLHDTDNVGMGCRAPALFFVPGTTRLYIRFDGMDFKDVGINGTEDDGLALNLFQKSHVQISVNGDEVSVQVNGEVVTEITLPGQPVVGNMVVVAGDKFYKPALAVLEKLVVTTF